MKELLLRILLNTASQTMQLTVRELLLNIKQHNDKATFEATLKAIYNSMTLLRQLAEKTKSTIDDKAVDIFRQPAIDIALEEGIVL